MLQKKWYFLIITTIAVTIGIYSSIHAKGQQLMPPFAIKLTNETFFYSKDLPSKKPVIIIYFAPDCEHCQILMNALFKKINEFKSAEIIMVTFKPLPEVADFEKIYQTTRYENIKVGTEAPIFFFKNYYHLNNTPFTVLFDKYRHQIISYQKQTPVDDLIKHLQLLK